MPTTPTQSESPGLPQQPDQPDLHHVIMQCAALHYAPIGRIILTDTAQRAGARIPDSKTMKRVYDDLIEQGLLEITKRGLRCVSRVLNSYTDDALAAGYLEVLSQVIQSLKRSRRGLGHPEYYLSYDELIRDLRIALFRADVEDCNELLGMAYRQFPDQTHAQHPLISVDSRIPNAPWFDELPAGLRLGTAEMMIADSVNRLVDYPGMLEILAHAEGFGDEVMLSSALRLSELLLLKGRADDCLRLLSTFADDQQAVLTLRAWAALVNGDLQTARQGYEQAYAVLKKSTRKRNIGLRDLAGIFSLLPLLADGDLDTVIQRAQRAGKDTDNALVFLYHALARLVLVRRGEQVGNKQMLMTAKYRHGPLHLMMLLISWWIEPEDLDRTGNDLDIIIDRATKAGFDWIAGQAIALRARARGESLPAGITLPLVDLLKQKDRWEFTLEALAAVGDSGASEAMPDTRHSTDERLIWRLELNDGELEIHPRIQKRSKRGIWSKGRAVALERLYSGSVDCIDSDDQPICNGIRVEHEPWNWGKDYYDFDPGRAWPALIGHPRLFREDDPAVALELVRAEPELHVRRDDKRLLVTMDPPLPQTGEALQVQQETRGRWRLVEYNAAQYHIGELLSDGLNCPLEAEQQLRQTLGQVAPLVNIHSDIGGDTQLPQIPGDPRPRLALTPLGDGLAAELLARPLGSDGPGYRPGEGGVELTAANPDGQRQRVSRDLAEERQRAAAVVDACPVLSTSAVEPHHWQLPDPISSLELLEQLQPLVVNETETRGSAPPADDQAHAQIILEWPQGQRMKLAGQVGAGSMRISLNQRGDWFEADGELRIDEQQVIDLQRLLALTATTSERFLPLGEGRFLALTDDFRRRLEDLRQLADSSAKKPRYHPLTATLLEEIGAGLGEFNTDQAWQQRVARLQTDDQPSAIPSTLSAELRDYQMDGYHWLMRLANWGVGACLADDMGLGKTVQTLAVLIERAPQGPSLVLAPTSVCANWLAEAERFAPTLRPRLFGQGDRQAQLDALGPFDLLISSYGLMQTEIDRFAAEQRHWNGLILDEAQAIKNPATRRARAALRLQADFRIATTGTPIENHLGELWSLFRFLNPGLLGSQEAFNKRYAGPIERDNDPQARDRLRRLVRPFILRRLKSDVLKELPPRTEIILQVEPGPRETAFYEALRRKMVDDLEQSGNNDDGQQQRFQVLAAITRLRRAACNPALIAPEAGIASAKLALFLDTVNELRDGRHKALVFSQFVDHLTLIRAALDQRGIHYQYLDGSTPAKARNQRVQAFQAGEGDLFLISLKAGGTGLNLTAADYVIHLDPWWNPAVEDQASDRAHRIGQQRPVTVYRLVARGSIEQQIIELHSRKRDLADGLLESGDSAARLNTSEMLALMRGETDPD